MEPLMPVVQPAAHMPAVQPAALTPAAKPIVQFSDVQQITRLDIADHQPREGAQLLRACRRLERR